MAAAPRFDARRKVEALDLRAHAWVVGAQVLFHVSEVDRLPAYSADHASTAGGGIPAASPLHGGDFMPTSPIIALAPPEGRRRTPAPASFN